MFTTSSPCMITSVTTALIPCQSICMYTNRQRSQCRQKFGACRAWGRNTSMLTCQSEEKAESRPRGVLIDKIDEERFQYDVSEVDPFEGGLIEDGRAYRQLFAVKSYELDGNLMLTIETVMKYIQETGLKHMKCIGANDADELGITPEMRRRNLFWVLRRIHISLHSYPSWRDVVEVKTWLHVSRRGTQLECLIRNSKTKETVARSLSLFVAMDKISRKLSTLSDDILREINPHSLKYCPATSMDEKRVPRLDKVDNVRMGINPMWSDLDFNVHVSNFKYINWTLEGVPRLILKKYELHNLWLEYRRECGIDSDLQSLSTRVKDDIEQESTKEGGVVGFNHLLLFPNGDEAARARTEWRPRCDPTRITP